MPEETLRPVLFSDLKELGIGFSHSIECNIVAGGVVAPKLVRLRLEDLRNSSARSDEPLVDSGPAVKSILELQSVALHKVQDLTFRHVHCTQIVTDDIYRACSSIQTLQLHRCALTFTRPVYHPVESAPSLASH